MKKTGPFQETGGEAKKHKGKIECTARRRPGFGTQDIIMMMDDVDDE